MQLESVVLREVALELRQPFAASWGTVRERNIIIVEAQADGLRGYGEVPVFTVPYYQPETPVTAWHVLREFLIPLAFASDWNAPSGLARQLRRIQGHPVARAGLEAAVWDLFARRQDTSLASLLNGSRAEIAAGIVLGLDDDRRLVDQAHVYMSQGYHRIKVKIKPGQDRRPLAALRRALPEADLGADANGSYTPAQADRLHALDDLGLSLLEQPLAPNRLTEHVSLQDRLQTPICLDESIEHAGDADTALLLGACQAVNIKLSRVGGLTEAVRVHDRAHARGVPLLAGGMLESGIGRAHSLALASLPGFVLPADLGPSNRYWQRDLIDAPITMSAGGTLTVPTGAGIGVEVDRSYLARLTQRRCTLYNR